MSDGRGKSDCCVVPQKLPNKAAGKSPAAAEVVEGRRQAKGNAIAARMSRRSMRGYDVGTALEGIRQTARGNKGARFTGLLHHIYAVERLEAAYYALRRDAAPGVDGQTWQSYGQALQANLADLSDRLARGGYRPQPVKRVYIDKADGSKRPLGVPALEDKIVQRASAEVLGAIYEQDFCGFSYGFRPGKSAHNALDAVAVGVSRRRVNWILDADISKFFDLRAKLAGGQNRTQTGACTDPIKRAGPVPACGGWPGHGRYFGVPDNGAGGWSVPAPQDWPDCGASHAVAAAVESHQLGWRNECNE